jgi:hypothetical protein
MQKIVAGNVEKHLRILTEDIGVRLAGSVGERRAADTIAEHLRSVCDDARLEAFDVNERSVAEQHLELCIEGQWQSFPCSLLSNTCGTGGKTVEAPVEFFAPQNDYLRDDLSYLSGKAVVFLNTFFETRDQVRRMVEAKPAFLMFVDIRYPDDAPRADGMFPVYTRTYGALTIVNVPYLHAWRWKEEGASAARLRVVGGMKPGTSQNVIAELPGTDPDTGIILVGSHHDTQADSVGADDNGTGVVAVMELARALADVPRKRTIRFISFGGEEQLSVGSAAYVRRHRDELVARGKCMLNFDSYGSLLGWSQWSCCGPDEMGCYLTKFFADNGEYVSPAKEEIPLADHFPFAACGIPSAWFGRHNCTSGRFFHHRTDDTISRVDIPLVTRHLNVSAACLAQLARQDALPFGPTFPRDQAKKIEITWQELFGGWTEPGLP